MRLCCAHAEDKKIHIGCTGASAGAPAQPNPATPPAQVQQTLDILQDDHKRAQLVQTWQTNRKDIASRRLDTGGTIHRVCRADNLGAQLLVQVSDWFGDVSSPLAAAARTVSDFPMISRWLVQLATDPIARRTLFETAWRLVLVIVGATSLNMIEQAFAYLGKKSPKRS